jgi:hypothetical protein
MTPAMPITTRTTSRTTSTNSVCVSVRPTRWWWCPTSAASCAATPSSNTFPIAAVRHYERELAKLRQRPESGIAGSARLIASTKEGPGPPFDPQGRGAKCAKNWRKTRHQWPVSGHQSQSQKIGLGTETCPAMGQKVSQSGTPRPMDASSESEWLTLIIPRSVWSLSTNRASKSVWGFRAIKQISESEW